MTTTQTLREMVTDAIVLAEDGDTDVEGVVEIIAQILDDTGSPAHIRIADELRGL